MPENQKLSQILANYGADEQNLINSSFIFAKSAHVEQRRLNGDDYITHPLETAFILYKLRLDAATIAAAFLHDVPENTTVSLEAIRKEFGDEVAYLVDGVTRLTKVRLRGSHDPAYIENLRKMFVAAAQDLRVIFIKLADRLHNMRTLNAIPPNKRENIATETLQIFAPLANRLGIGEIKGELEDLSFRYVNPKAYQTVIKQTETEFARRHDYINRVIKIIRELLGKGEIKPLDIHGRAKHIYSLYNKLKKYSTDDVSQIADLVAVRVIVSTTADCYAALGIIHEHYKPLPGRIKDYISVPKPNGYQSLHTTIFGPEGRVLEIQIRTPEMHRYAEHGIAAHWSYVETAKHKLPNLVTNNKLTWVRQLRELHQALDSDPKEFLTALRLDFFQDRIFCFTPKGDVIDLPAGSIPLDFAFAVHSDLGYRCQGAKVNGKIIKISDSLNNGDVVEIMTSKNPVKIPRDWLRLVKTSRARDRVKRALKN